MDWLATGNPPATSMRSLIIVGSSARAAAESACLAGYLPWTCDQFADVDLAAIGSARFIHKFPTELLAAFADAPFAPWLYTGGLENYPELVDQLADLRPLLGNPGEILRQIRNPRSLADSLAAARLPTLLTYPGDSPPTSGRWLFKPLRSGGGLGVRLVDCGVTLPTASDRHYFQLAAPPAARTLGAVFVMAGGQCRFLGASSLHSGRTLGRNAADFSCDCDETESDFLYRGSSACDLDPWDESAIVRAGEAVARAFQPRGIVGLDVAVLDGLAWVLEVNPRYPASAELLDLGGSPAVIEHHISACVAGRLPPPTTRPTARRPMAKWIVYASERFQWTAAHERWRVAWKERFPDLPSPLADVPSVGTWFAAGWPVCTLRVPIATPAADRAADLAVAQELAALERSVWQEMLALVDVT